MGFPRAGPGVGAYGCVEAEGAEGDDVEEFGGRWASGGRIREGFADVWMRRFGCDREGGRLGGERGDGHFWWLVRVEKLDKDEVDEEYGGANGGGGDGWLFILLFLTPEKKTGCNRIDELT